MALLARPRSLRLALVIAIAMSAVSARAQEGTLEVEGCDRELATSLRSALAIELTDAEPSVRALLRDRSLSATVRCVDGAVEVRVEHRIRAQRLGQPVPIEPEGHARRIAIVAFELLHAAADPEPAERERASSGDRSAVGVAPSDRAPTPTVLLRARATAAILGDPPALSGGGALGVELAPSALVHVIVDVEAIATRRGIDAGDVDVALVSGALGCAFGEHVAPVALHAGPIVRGGISVLGGTPRAELAATGRTSIDPWLAIGLLARAGVALDDTPIRLDVELEGGALVLGRTATALGARVITLAGAFAALRFGIAIALG